MAEFAYNNAINASTDYTSFELNCGYYPWVFFQKKSQSLLIVKNRGKTILQAPKSDGGLSTELLSHQKTSEASSW